MSKAVSLMEMRNNHDESRLQCKLRFKYWPSSECDLCFLCGHSFMRMFLEKTNFNPDFVVQSHHFRGEGKGIFLRWGWGEREERGRGEREKGKKENKCLCEYVLETFTAFPKLLQWHIQQIVYLALSHF